MQVEVLLAHCIAAGLALRATPPRIPATDGYLLCVPLLHLRSCVRCAGFGTLGLYMDANKNPAIFQQLLALDPASVIAKVLR